jgi:catechol 2,3-dioxygenase-like lactoylglutathione lyase family enzyme
MDYEEYRRRFYADPQPEPRFAFASTGGAVIFIEDYQAAVDYYRGVLGPPAYVEGDHTHGWRIGDSWLTVFPSKDGGPRNTEVQLLMATPEEAERLQAAFIAGGGSGPDPSDQLMYEPIRSCPVTDPFGTEILVYARR